MSPTVYGNVMLGPTADDVTDRSATGSTAAGLALLLDAARSIVPSLVEDEVTAAYVGLRAATEHARLPDPRVARGALRLRRWHPLHRPLGIDGDRRTGAEGLAEAGLSLSAEPRETDLRMPNIGELRRRPYQEPDLIARDPEFGRIVCFCERVTRAELTAAMESPIPPYDLDGVRRRTRALMGRCQGFFCAAQVGASLAGRRGSSIAEVLGALPGGEHG